jgi:uncharacterized protein DUF6919
MSRIDRILEWIELRTGDSIVESHFRKVRRSGWPEARTLDDAGELVARWFEGRVPRTPFYMDDQPDLETTPAMVRALVKANLSGYVTTNSQAGAHEDDVLRDAWCAWVHGFLEPGAAARLVWAAEARGVVAVCGTPGRRTRHVPVFDAAGEVVEYAAVLSVRNIDDELRDAHPDLLEEFLGAVQVVLVDPEPGRNDRLWALLDEFAGEQVSRP